MKAVTNGPKQVVECGNSMKNLSIYCIAKKKNKKKPKKQKTSDFVQHRQMFIGRHYMPQLKLQIDNNEQQNLPNKPNKPQLNWSSELTSLVCVWPEWQGQSISFLG